MYRARADAVQGRYVFSGGRRLICIGNAAVSPSDLVWTDGRCVYGYHRTGGTPYIPVAESPIGGLPILMEDGTRQYFANGKLHPLVAGNGTEPWGFVNNGADYRIFDDTILFDAELDADGNLYTVERGYVAYNHLIEDFEFMPTRILRNGETIVDIDLMPYLQEALADTASIVEGIVPSVPESEGRINHGSETKIYYADIQPQSAKVTADGHYCICVIAHGEMERKTWAYDDIGIYPVIGGGGGAYWVQRSNGGRARRTRLYLFTDTGVITLAEYRRTETWGYASQSTYDEHQEKFVDDYSVHVPIHDGYYYTFGGELDNLLYPAFRKYSGKIYSPDGTLICKGAFHPVHHNLSIAKLGGDSYLINAWRIGLYLSKGGELETLADRCRNFRLRPMNDIRKWKGE